MTLESSGLRDFELRGPSVSQLMSHRDDLTRGCFTALLIAAAFAIGAYSVGAQSRSRAKPARQSGSERATRRKSVDKVKRLPASAPLSRTVLLDAARAGGDYLVRMQQPDGRFYYWYYPATDRVDTTQYNVLRHSGAALALFDLYMVTGERRYLDAARRATAFLKTRFRPAVLSQDSTGTSGSGSRQIVFHSEDPVLRPALYVLDFDDKVKLGANGLALIVLIRQIYADAEFADIESARGLAEMILRLQRPDGGFESYYRLSGNEPSGDTSLYYPGEAILGLLSLYDVTGDSRLADAAHRGADYLIDSQRRLRHLPPDAWLMQALELLLNHDGRLANGGRRQKYVAHLLALAESMMRDQYGDRDPRGYAGGFAPGIPRSTPAASRAEGLVAAYRVAVALKDSRSNALAAALRACARFQLSQQFRENAEMKIPNPERASGGFRESTTSMRVRIDFVQHNVCSLLQMARTIY